MSRPTLAEVHDMSLDDASQDIYGCSAIYSEKLKMRLLLIIGRILVSILRRIQEPQ